MSHPHFAPWISSLMAMAPMLFQILSHVWAMRGTTTILISPGCNQPPQPKTWPPKNRWWLRFALINGVLGGYPSGNNSLLWKTIMSKRESRNHRTRWSVASMAILDCQREWLLQFVHVKSQGVHLFSCLFTPVIKHGKGKLLQMEVYSWDNHFYIADFPANPWNLHSFSAA